MKRILVALAAVTLSTTAFGWSKAGDSSATFSGKGPAGFKIEGKTKAVEVKDEGGKLSVIVGLKDLDTGIELRNKHMRDKYLEVEKFPDARLDVAADALKVPGDGESVESTAKGTFSLHGKTKDVSFKYKAQCKAGACDIDGTADINFNDFGVNVPSYMGITVKPDITVRAQFQVKK
jgi:polyisoprenoid-binding protein YceI